MVSADLTGQIGAALIGNGPIGILAAIAIWFARDTLKRERGEATAALLRERERADAARADAAAERAARDALVRELLDKVVPALAESSRVVQDFLEVSRRHAR